MATITTGNNPAEPRFFISSYYALVNKPRFFKFDVPKSLNPSNNIKTIKISTGENNVNDILQMAIEDDEYELASKLRDFNKLLKDYNG